MYNIMKKRSETIRADKDGGFSAPEKKSSKLSHQELYDHHSALAGHYRTVANEQKTSADRGVGPGAESDKLAGDESKYETEEGGSAGELVGDDFSGESIEDATGQQESAAYEKGESADQEALEDLGTFQGAGGSLRNSKEEKPLSRFADKKKKKGY